MSETKLRLIKGGLGPKEEAEKQFVSAFATDTRLMGEVAMGIHWHIKNHPAAKELFQFFSFDTESEGLDNYKSVWSEDADEIALIRQTMIGPLGGQDVLLSEREARAVFTRYYNHITGRSPEFTEGINEYRFLIDEPAFLDADEFDALFDKLCTDIISPEQLVNYYIMRCLAKDSEGRRYLSSEYAKGEIKHISDNSAAGAEYSGRMLSSCKDIFPDLPLVSLLKNTIQEKDGHYISNSLAEHDSRYELLVTDITIEGDRVSSCERGPGMHISNTEAAMILAHPEFITVYRILADPDDFEEDPLEFEYNTMITEHESGRLYMAFNSNNDHVNDPNYLLSNDIFGVYYITNNGEVIVSAASKKNIIKMERSLLHTPIGAMLLPTGKYEFQEPVLLQFVNSSIDSFDEFLQLITDPEM